MDKVNTKWWTFARWSDEYENGVDKYIEKTFASSSQGDQICYPCEICHYRYWRNRNVIKEHMICNGFVPRSDILLDVREDIERKDIVVDSDVPQYINDVNDDIKGLLSDTFKEGPNEDTKKFFKLIEEGQQELYPGYITKKTKDNVCARRDLKVLKILPELQPIEIDDLREEIPRSRFWMTLEKKRLFCRTIKNAKLPQGYASNIARCVQVNEGKITGYKSHDAHFYMHYLLPIVIKATLPKEVATPLIRLCQFFKGIWVHLVEEIRLGGPICNRCMYAIERFLHELKDDVRNKACPEGSMAEAYWAKECLRFCARYINRPKTSSTSGKSKTAQPFLPNIGRPTRGKGNPTKKNQYGFMIDHITWDQAHQYLLFNCDCKEVKRYISEHMATLSSHRKRKWDTVQNHSKEFMAWFKEKVACMIQQGAVVPEHLKWLSKGPSYVAKRYTRYSVNGFHFHTMKRDANSISQNRGVTLNALTPSFSSSKDQNPIMGSVAYYGSIEDIIELSYHGQFSVVLFRCMWFYSEMNDEFILVNKNRTIGGGEPFILASQARQVFYVEDLTKNGWFYVVHNLPTELSDGSTRGMSPLSHLPHVKDIATKKAARKGSSNKSGSMAAFVQNTTKHGVENHIELPPVNSIGKFQQRDHQNGNNLSGKQALQPLKKHQQKTFCHPGSLTAFRELRKKQSENMIQDNETNSTSNLEVAYEGQLISNIPAKKKHRGPTKLVKVHARPREERPYLILNIYGQLVGPTDEVVDEFTQFLGTVARNSELAPLNYVEWPSLPTHNKIWDSVQEQIEALESQEHEHGPNTIDPYYQVIKKPEHNGRVRLYGKGVTMTDLKKKKGSNPRNATNDTLQVNEAAGDEHSSPRTEPSNQIIEENLD
uniref:Uncharacterized protein n=1 Tax=Chenopodium quinoa TaxID=63459 RepID=A0A803MBK1_CHEQI